MQTVPCNTPMRVSKFGEDCFGTSLKFFLSARGQRVADVLRGQGLPALLHLQRERGHEAAQLRRVHERFQSVERVPHVLRPELLLARGHLR